MANSRAPMWQDCDSDRNGLSPWKQVPQVLNKSKISLSGPGLRIYLFNEYLSSSSTVLCAEDTTVNKTKYLSSEDLHFS